MTRSDTISRFSFSFSVERELNKYTRTAFLFTPNDETGAGGTVHVVSNLVTGTPGVIVPPGVDFPG
jgi:hypothetical protein